MWTTWSEGPQKKNTQEPGSEFVVVEGRMISWLRVLKGEAISLVVRILIKGTSCWYGGY
jgi:hypothetical protein